MKPKLIGKLLYDCENTRCNYFGLDSFRMCHSKNEFTKRYFYINGIESFWGYAKNRLVKFKRIDKSMFNLHLKGC